MCMYNKKSKRSKNQTSASGSKREIRFLKIHQVVCNFPRFSMTYLNFPRFPGLDFYTTLEIHDFPGFPSITGTNPRYLYAHTFLSHRKNPSITDLTHLPVVIHVQYPDPSTHLDRVRCFLTLFLEVFHRVLWFSPSLKNQNLI